MKPAIAYCRVSTDRQGKSGLGLDAQRQAIARFAGAEGFNLVGEFTDVETGKGADAMAKRPQLAAAPAEARRNNACPVIVTKLDRLSRERYVDGGSGEGHPQTPGTGRQCVPGRRRGCRSPRQGAVGRTGGENMSDELQTYHELTGPEGDVLGLVTRYEGNRPD